MKLGITGASTYRDYDHFQHVMDKISVPITLIVTGGRDGVEEMARRYARQHDLSILIHHARTNPNLDWMRRFHLLLTADADNILAFNYPGTHTASLLKSVARVAGKRLNMVCLEADAVPHAIAARYGEEI